MEQKNFLRETANLLYSTNQNLNYAISRLQDCDKRLSKEIHATLANIEIILKGEVKQREELEKAYNLEKAWDMRTYFFMVEKGYINEFKEYCTNNPLDEFKEIPIERIKRQLKK